MKKAITLSRIFVTVFLTFIIQTNVQAALVWESTDITFTGTVSDIVDTDGLFTGSGLVIGDAVSGSVSYFAKDSNNNNFADDDAGANRGEYEQAKADGAALTMTIDGHQWSIDPNFGRIDTIFENGSSNDTFFTNNVGGTLGPNAGFFSTLTVNQMFLKLIDTDATILSSDQLSPLDVFGNGASWETQLIVMELTDGTNSSFISANITATINDKFGVLVSPIPIPPAAYLLGTGLLGLIGISRRNKHS